MALPALSSLTLGYRPLWNKDRALAGVQLYLDCDPSLDPDVPHFLRILQEMWSQAAPPLLLSPQTHQLLSALLETAPAGSPWVEVRGDWLENSTLYAQAQAAHAARVVARRTRSSGRHHGGSQAAMPASERAPDPRPSPSSTVSAWSSSV